eukprot:4208566-Pyramimonas_sp.AAC.2
MEHIDYSYRLGDVVLRLVPPGTAVFRIICKPEATTNVGQTPGPQPSGTSSDSRHRTKRLRTDTDGYGVRMDTNRPVMQTRVQAWARLQPSTVVEHHRRASRVVCSSEVKSNSAVC